MKAKQKFLRRIVVCSFFLFTFAIPEYSAEPEKVWGASVPAAFMVYIVNPDAFAGWPSKLYEYEAEFIPEKYKQLPILGSWHGGGGIPDKELLMKYKVKNALVINLAGQTPEDTMDQIKKMGR